MTLGYIRVSSDKQTMDILCICMDKGCHADRKAVNLDFSEELAAYQNPGYNE